MSTQQFLFPDLKKYKYFSSLSDNALEVLSKKIKVVHFPAGSEIIKEGSMGNSFYFVREGEVEVIKKTRLGQEEKISIIGSGEGIGEMALLTGSVRSSSVRALTNVAFYELPKTDFEDIILQETSFKNMLLDKVNSYKQYARIRSLQPFEFLPHDKMCALMERLVEKRYAPGENIIVQGEKGDKYFIIKSGRVAVLKKKKGEDISKQAAVLSDGDAFGEEALIREDPRNATCQAIEETTVFVLDKKDFNQIVKASFLENIFPEEINSDTYLNEYVVIDARIPPEYEEEHIYGSVNIPVEILREQSNSFDRSKQYITYCLNDSRGMVAAFLLKNRGFNARCLRGGVSGWLGPVVTDTDGIYMPGQ
jgi:CRP-like cAMP-binding protein